MDVLLFVIHILFGFLALVGLVCVWRGIADRLAAVEDEERYLLVLLHGQGAAVRLRAAVAFLQGCRDRPRGGIIAVDIGLTEEMKRACAILAREAGCVRLCTPQDVQEWLGDVSNGRGDATARQCGEDHVL